MFWNSISKYISPLLAGVNIHGVWSWIRDAKWDRLIASDSLHIIINENSVEQISFCSSQHRYRYSIGNEEPIPLIGADANPIRGSRGQCGITFALLMGVDKGIESGNSSSCKYIDVVMHRPREGRCIMAVQQPCHFHNYDSASDGEGYGSSSLLSYEMDPTTLKPKLPSILNVFKSQWTHRQRDTMIASYLQHRNDMIREVRAKLTSVHAITSGPVLVMCANDGHASLILNFFCNLDANGITTPPWVTRLWFFAARFCTLTCTCYRCFYYFGF